MHARTYRPASYSLDAMGEISEWMVIMPSKGRSGSGFTILASTCARALRRYASLSDFFAFYELSETYRVFPNEHSTHPSSGPKLNTGTLDSSGKRPSNRKDCLRAVARNSFSGSEGEGGLMIMCSSTFEVASKGCFSLFGLQFFLLPHRSSQRTLIDGSSDHSQSTGVSRQGLHVKQLSARVQGCPDRAPGGRVQPRFFERFYAQT